MSTPSANERRSGKGGGGWNSRTVLVYLYKVFWILANAVAIFAYHCLDMSQACSTAITVPLGKSLGYVTRFKLQIPRIMYSVASIYIGFEITSGKL